MCCVACAGSTHSPARPGFIKTKKKVSKTFIDDRGYMVRACLGVHALVPLALLSAASCPAFGSRRHSVPWLRRSSAAHTQVTTEVEEEVEVPAPRASECWLASSSAGGSSQRSVRVVLTAAPGVSRAMRRVQCRRRRQPSPR